MRVHLSLDLQSSAKRFIRLSRSSALFLLTQVRPRSGRVSAVGANVAAGVRHHARIARAFVIEIAAIVIVVRADVTGHLGAFALVLVRLDDRHLHDFAAGAVDWMRDVGVQLRSAVVIARGTVLVEMRAARVAKAGSQVVL